MTLWSLLGPAAIHPDPTRVTGGRPSITADDVRIALSGLRERPFLFGMAAFLGCQRSFRDLVRLFDDDLLQHAVAGEWINRAEDRAIVARLAEWILIECINSRSRHETYTPDERLPQGSVVMRCPQCHGKARHDGAECRLCYRERPKRADGRLVVTDVHRRRAIGVSNATWYRLWCKRYNEHCLDPLAWEGRAVGYVRNRLRLTERSGLPNYPS